MQRNSDEYCTKPLTQIAHPLSGIWKHTQLEAMTINYGKIWKEAMWVPLCTRSIFTASVEGMEILRSLFKAVLNSRIFSMDL